MASVLIVDDEQAMRELMVRWAASLGLESRTAADADQALETLRTEACDLAVIDVMMPGHSGLWLANELRREHPHTAVVIATGYRTLVDAEADTEPIADLLIKPFQRDRFALAVDRGRQWRKRAIEEGRWHAQLSLELRDVTEQVCAEVERRAANGAAEEDVLSALATERTPDVMHHGDRVARFARSVARELGCESALSPTLARAARFHDIGKIAIPEALRTKPSPLTSGEEAIMRRHVDVGAEILASTHTLAEASSVVLATHEWYSGGGYPMNISGVAIPLAARIIATVDAYDTMTLNCRDYRPRFTTAEAIAELLRCTNSQFDSDVVAAFLAVLSRH
jgi:putative two-component system response regulator